MKKGNVTILASIFVIATMMFSMGLGTMAYFTDTKTSPGSTFTAGTLKLGSDEFASFDLGTIDMAPGDLTEKASITIINTGSLPLAWFGNWYITGGDLLREAIYIDDAQMEFLDKFGNANAWSNNEPTDHFITNGVGSGTYASAFAYLAAPPQSKFGVISIKAWDDNALMCPGQGYEHMGALNPGYMYRLTIRFGFAAGAGNEYQGDVTNPVTITFKVDATQVNAGALNALKPTLSNHLGWLNTQLSHQP
jgi:predicted ribosomally synthesized peptide with SipW-like signal peptide